MSHFEYEIATTFPNGYESVKLYKDIRANVAKPTSYSFSGDTLFIDFNPSLDSGQQTALATVIATHTPDPDTIGDQQLIFQLEAGPYTNTSYQSCGIFEYPGRNIDTLTHIKFVGSASTSSYTVRIYDLTNSQTIVETTFTNTTDDANDMGALSNIPYAPSLFDVQIKVSSGSVSAYPKSIIFYYYDFEQ